MKTKIAFSSFFILIFSLTSCGQEITTPWSVTQTPVVIQPLTEVSTITPLPTVSFVLLPTSIPYPTASMVKANAVAFIERDNENNLSLWVVNVDGSGERKLVDIANNKSWVYDQILQWSPDGKWISYFSKDELWIVSSDGSVNKKVLSVPDIYIFVWSPDSSKMAYIQRDKQGPIAQITVGILDLASEKTFEISSHQAPDPMPLSWSPDGKHLLFAKGFSYTLYEVSTGKVIKEIKPDGMGCWVGWNTWSPNSEWFFYTQHGNGSYNLRICLGGLNGMAWQIEGVGVIISPPVWDKTGDYLYFVVGEMDLDIGPNWCKNQRLVRYDVEARKVETLFSLEEYGSTGFPWTVSISPNGQMLDLYSYIYYEDYSHPGHIYVDTSRPKQNHFVILNIQSLSATKFTLEFEGEINGYSPPPTWLPDNQKMVFFLRDLVRQSYGISYSDYGSFYSLDVTTGKVTLFSGVHAVENAIISPIDDSP